MVLEKWECENCGFNDFMVKGTSPGFYGIGFGYYKPFACFTCKKVVNIKLHKTAKKKHQFCPNCKKPLIDYSGNIELEVYKKSGGKHTCPNCQKPSFKWMRHLKF